eukprot:294160-Prymnesium_polylepis.1
MTVLRAAALVVLAALAAPVACAKLRQPALANHVFHHHPECHHPGKRKKLAAEEKKWLKSVVAEVCESVRVACKHGQDTNK